MSWRSALSRTRARCSLVLVNSSVHEKRGSLASAQSSGCGEGEEWADDEDTRRRYPKDIIDERSSGQNIAPSKTTMLDPQMSPVYCFETREDCSNMATVGEATVSSSHSTDSTNHVHTEVQGESWERSPVTPPPSGAAQRTGRWTPDEKILFLYGLKRFGKGRWKKMSIYLPHRYVPPLSNDDASDS